MIAFFPEHISCAVCSVTIIIIIIIIVINVDLTVFWQKSSCLGCVLCFWKIMNKATPIGNYVSGPPPASYFGECEISEIHG